MERAYKYRIYPNNEQKGLIAKTFGCARFVYNYFLTKRKEAYESNKETLNYYACCKMLTELKKENEFIWLKEVDSHALQRSLKNLDSAFQNFFRECKKSHNVGYPIYKKKYSAQTYTTVQTKNSIMVIDDQHIKLPKLGIINCVVHRVPEGRILSATVSQNPSGEYYVSLCCTECEFIPFEKTGGSVGVHFGLKSFATFSTGEKIDNPKILEKHEKKLKRLERSLHRKVKGSNNRNKQRVKVAKLHQHIANIRKDFLHKLSLDIIKNQDIICIENLNVKKMMRNHIYAKAISDVSWGEFVRQLEYKAIWYGKEVLKADPFFASSQICSVCGEKYPEIKNLSTRTWKCPHCHTIHDRDINAAINVKNELLTVGQDMSEPAAVN